MYAKNRRVIILKKIKIKRMYASQKIKLNAVCAIIFALVPTVWTWTCAFVADCVKVPAFCCCCCVLLFCFCSTSAVASPFPSPLLHLFHPAPLHLLFFLVVAPLLLRWVVHLLYVVSLSLSSAGSQSLFRLTCAQSPHVLPSLFHSLGIAFTRHLPLSL